MGYSSCDGRFRNDGCVYILDDDGNEIAVEYPEVTRCFVKYEVVASQGTASVVFTVVERKTNRSESVRTSIEFSSDNEVKFKYLAEPSELAAIAIPRDAEFLRLNGGNTKSTVSWQDIDSIYNLKSNYTSLQKKAEWPRFQGKVVEWKGEVSHVDEGRHGLSLHVKMNASTLTSDVLVRLKPREYDIAIKLHEGDVVRFTGRLEDWGTVLFTITISEGRIIP